MSSPLYSGQIYSDPQEVLQCIIEVLLYMVQCLYSMDIFCLNEIEGRVRKVDYKPAIVPTPGIFLFFPFVIVHVSLVNQVTVFLLKYDSPWLYSCINETT